MPRLRGGGLSDHGATIAHEYALEYGADTVEIQADALAPGQRVVALDDLLATGGTMSAAIELLRAVGADVRGAACIVELAFLRGRAYPTHSSNRTRISYVYGLMPPI